MQLTAPPIKSISIKQPNYYIVELTHRKLDLTYITYIYNTLVLIPQISVNLWTHRIPQTSGLSKRMISK